MSDQPTEADDRRVRPFADFLLEHRSGAAHTRAGELLQEVVGAVLDTGKKGSVTLTVSIEQMKNAPDTLLTTINVTSKVPVEAPKAAVFYADRDRNLQRTDPNQLQFEGLKEVEGPRIRDERVVPGRVVGGDVQ